MMLRLALVAFLSGCCNQDIAHKLAQRAAIINRASAEDAQLDAEALRIARDNAEAWMVQAHILGGDHLPEELKAKHLGHDDAR